MNGNATFQNVQAIQQHGANAIQVEVDPATPGAYCVVFKNPGDTSHTVVLQAGWSQVDADHYAATVRPVMSAFALSTAGIARDTCIDAVDAMRRAQAASPGNLFERVMAAIRAAF